MFSYVKGYTIADVSAKKLGKEDLTRLAEPEAVREAASAALKSKGKVYLFRNAQKQCVCCYILEKVKNYTAPEGLDTSANGKTVLVLKQQVIAEANAAQQSEFEEVVKQEVKELVLYTDAAAVEWNDTLITAKNVEREVWENWYVWLPLAVLWGIAFDNWMLGILFALCCGGTSEMLFYARKKKENTGKRD